MADRYALRKTPFVEVAPDNAIPVHIGFVQEKLEAGLFWAIFNSLSTSEERGKLFADWGHLFEKYIGQVLGSSIDNKTEVLISFPRFSDRDEESFDGVVIAGDHLFVLEYKGWFLKAEAKYAEDEATLNDDLNRKFGKGDDGGLSQLARKVGQVFNSNPTWRRTIIGVDTSKTTVVVPILVVQEAFVSSEIAHPFLYDVFGSLNKKHVFEEKSLAIDGSDRLEIDSRSRPQWSNRECSEQIAGMHLPEWNVFAFRPRINCTLGEESPSRIAVMK